MTYSLWSGIKYLVSVKYVATTVAVKQPGIIKYISAEVNMVAM